MSKLICSNYRRYKGVKKTACCFMCWFKYTFFRGKIQRKPSTRQLANQAIDEIIDH